MPNIDTLIESISQQISYPLSQSTSFFSTLDQEDARIKLLTGRFAKLEINSLSYRISPLGISPIERQTS